MRKTPTWRVTGCEGKEAEMGMGGVKEGFDIINEKVKRTETVAPPCMVGQASVPAKKQKFLY